MSIRPFTLTHDMNELRTRMATYLMNTTPRDRGSWQGTKSPGSAYELPNVIVNVPQIPTAPQAVEICKPDMPWAEDHFDERVGGVPLNPAPSYVDWPWHSKAEAEKFVREGGKFDHTYPERMWPWGAGEEPFKRGIRFSTGDLEDVVGLLKRDPHTRQAYLPIWFPEDTGAMQEGKPIRVPCTLGYHFIRNGQFLDLNYFMRSCDLTRHFHNDVYMAVRLLQRVIEELKDTTAPPYVGEVTIFISNLHLFKNDAWRY